MLSRRSPDDTQQVVVIDDQSAVMTLAALEDALKGIPQIGRVEVKNFPNPSSLTSAIRDGVLYNVILVLADLKLPGKGSSWTQLGTEVLAELCRREVANNAARIILTAEDRPGNIVPFLKASSVSQGSLSLQPPIVDAVFARDAFGVHQFDFNLRNLSNVQTVLRFARAKAYLARTMPHHPILKRSILDYNPEAEKTLFVGISEEGIAKAIRDFRELAYNALISHPFSLAPSSRPAVAR